MAGEALRWTFSLLTVGLLHGCATSNTLAAASVCQIPSCFCANSTGNSDVNTASPYDVTCYVKTVSQSDRWMETLTPDMTSVKLICSDPYTQSELTGETFQRVSWLQRLSLDNCRFASVSPTTFLATPGMTSLEVTHGRFIQPLPTTLLSSSPQLSHLTLSNCDLDSLPKLCALRQLEALVVSGQRLTSLDDPVSNCSDSDVFPNLTVLDVSNNSLAEFPRTLLSRAPRLRELHVQHNHLRELPLEEDTGLEVLDAVGQQLRDADFMGSSCVSRLRVLRVEGDGNTQFPFSTLRNLSNLTHLHVSNFNLNDSLWDVFPSLGSLQHLSLPVNLLTTINLTGEVPLRHLNLSHNSVVDMNSDTFAPQGGLEVIDLSWNNLTKVMPNVFYNLTSLNYLALEHNQLKLLVQSGLRNLPSLQVLKLGYNKLNSLPLYPFRGLRALKHFSAENNSISFLPYITDAPELVSLDFGYNNIGSLYPRKFSGLPKLEYLVLNGNRLRQVESSLFQEAPLLSWLDLHGNQIRTVYPFGKHPSLMMIRMEQNQIENVHEVFYELPQLTGLFLDHNLISMLTTRTLPPTLQTLNMAWNQLWHIEPSIFSSLRQLRVVEIGGNYRLNTLPFSSVQIPSSMSPKPSFSVGPNVFLCDCRMAYLKAWTLAADIRSGDQTLSLQDDLPVFINTQFVNCASYFRPDLELLDDVPLSDFVCPYTQPKCDESCTCCTARDQDGTVYSNGPNCTCVLTCPDSCACFHRDSRHVDSVTPVLCDWRNLTEIPEAVPARATHVHLDGNQLTVLKNGTLNHLTNVRFLNLNNSWIETIEPGCFEGMQELRRLDLSHNAIVRLDEATFGSLTSLEELNLQHNHLQHLHPAALARLTSLRRLYLNSNWLERVDSFSQFPPGVGSLTIAENPWSCECDFMEDFLKFLITYRKSLLDYADLRCYWHANSTSPDLLEMLSNSSHIFPELGSVNITLDPTTVQYGVAHDSVLMSQYQYSVLCRNSTSRTSIYYYDDGSQAASLSGATAAVVGVVLAVMMVVVIGAVCVWRRWEIQALLYVKLGLRLFDNAAKLDRTEGLTGQKKLAAAGEAANGAPGVQRVRRYDAFVSYSHHDEDFVVNQLVPRLEEKGRRQYKLCVHYRDFPVGDAIADTIVDSVEQSQRTILLVSQHFVDSDWCRFEFRTAHQNVLREGGHRLIIVLLDEVDMDQLDPDLKMAMKTRTYLQKKDPWFWEKLYFAMPDQPCKQQHNP